MKKSAVVEVVWFLCFLLICFSCYFYSIYKKSIIKKDLLERIAILDLEKREFLEKKEKLLLEIASQNDPEWIKLLFKRELGLVPEGQIKVYLADD